MKKIILGILLLIIVAVVVAIYYVFTNIDSLVEAAIEKYGSQATQTAVRVDKVNLQLTEGAGSIQGLTVANPKGFEQPNAFALGEVGTDIDIKSLTEQPYVIESVTVRAPQVFAEVNKNNNINLNELKKNLQAGAPQRKEPPAEEKPKAEPRLIIRKVLFTEGTISAKVVPLENKEYDLKLPTLEMSNLGGENGATPKELANEILNRLLDRALEVIKEKGIDAEIDKLKSQAEEKIEEEKSQLEEKGSGKLQEEKEKLEDKLKGLMK